MNAERFAGIFCQWLVGWSSQHEWKLDLPSYHFILTGSLLESKKNMPAVFTWAKWLESDLWSGFSTLPVKSVKISKPTIYIHNQQFWEAHPNHSCYIFLKALAHASNVVRQSGCISQLSLSEWLDAPCTMHFWFHWTNFEDCSDFRLIVTKIIESSIRCPLVLFRHVSNRLCHEPAKLV